jgi:hypothetical protein
MPDNASNGRGACSKASELFNNTIPYSASAVKLSFWLPELGRTLSLMREGKSADDIRRLAEESNIFVARSPALSKQIANTALSRACALPYGLRALFLSEGLETRRLIALTAVMLTDRLFLSFMYEVFREKLIAHDDVLTDADFRIFFRNKQREDGHAAKWTDQTLDKLRNNYKRYLSESGLIERGAGERNIIRPLIDRRLDSALTDSGLQIIRDALSGAR